MLPADLRLPVNDLNLSGRSAFAPFGRAMEYSTNCSQPALIPRSLVEGVEYLMQLPNPQTSGMHRHQIGQLLTVEDLARTPGQ
jgi:hypothetical protein